MLNNLTNLFAKKGENVGIEINSQKVNIAQIAKQGQQYKLIKNVSADIPEGVYEDGHGLRFRPPEDDEDAPSGKGKKDTDSS